jgi:hypothetical protein
MTNETSDTAKPPRAAHLVLAVARLGEGELRGWWGSHGLGQAGRYVLGGAFRRTWRCAGLELDVLCAARRHNALLERPTALHLFSDHLPFRRIAEAWLAEEKTRIDAAATPARAPAAAARLQKMISDQTSGIQPRGEPVAAGLRLGEMRPRDFDDDQRLDEVLRHLAAAYLNQDADFQPPYFDLMR